MSSASADDIRLPFRPRARVLQLLGDELIGSHRLAVFELVKNAYDADADEVHVTLDLQASDKPSITVIDDGEGMTFETLRDIWLVPGDDHRKKQRTSLTRTPRHGRLPLGEKGLGRFAVHKLGNKIRLITRAQRSQECVVEIDWNELIERPFLHDAVVTIRRRKPELFSGRRTGTWIEITELRQRIWNRGEIRRLHRQIISICSPFDKPGEFRAHLQVPGREQWIEDVPDADEILNRAPWRFSFRLRNGRFDWDYSFRALPGLKLEPRKVRKRGDNLRLPPASGDDRTQKKVVADKLTTKGIGEVKGVFHIFDLDRDLLRRMPDVRLLTEYLDENGGVRVYRDGIRVYNYGEPGDDWLGLDLRRVNLPTRRISRNIVIGAVHLSLERSTGLMEKTNREGFVENDACDRLKRIVLGALAALETERSIDKDRIRKLVASVGDPETKPIQKPIDELRKALERKNLGQKFEPYIAKIEHDYRGMQETLLSAGMSGLNLAVVFHEVERGVRVLHEVIANDGDPEVAVEQSRELMHLLDGFSTLLRRDARSTHSARKLIEAARRFSVLRLRHHRVRLVCPLLEEDGTGFESKFSFGLVVGALNNLIDNALYWLRVRWPDVPDDAASGPRALYINASDDFEAGPAIVIADTGTGFQDDPELMVRPFFTRKPTGMGLGMYYANMAMELNGGQLIFPQPGDVDLPPGFDGAVVALVFKRLG